MKDDRVYLSHILEAVDNILRFTSAGEDAFRTDLRTQLAVIRCFEIIGEATKSLSTAFRDAHPGIPWKRIAGMRDRLIHAYFGVDLDAVWSTVTRVLPGFRADVARLIDEVGPAQ